MADYRGIRRIQLYEIRHTDEEGWVGTIELTWHPAGDDPHARHYTTQTVEIYGETGEVVKKRSEWLIRAIRSAMEKEV